MSVAYTSVLTTFVRGFVPSYHSTTSALCYRQLEVRRFPKEEMPRINKENLPWKMPSFKSNGFSPQQLLTYNSTIFCSPAVSKVGGEGGGGPVFIRYPWGYPDIRNDVT